MMEMETKDDRDRKVASSIQLDRKGNVVEVLDSSNKPRPIAQLKGPIAAVVGQPGPSGKKITHVTRIEIVTVENEDKDHDDPCWIRDSMGNWRCVCRPPLC